MLSGIIDGLTGANKNARLKGTVVLMCKNVLDLNDFGATVIDGISEFLGKGVTCQLISSTLVDPSEPPSSSSPSPSFLPNLELAKEPSILVAFRSLVEVAKHAFFSLHRTKQNKKRYLGPVCL